MGGWVGGWVGGMHSFLFPPALLLEDSSSNRLSYTLPTFFEFPVQVLCEQLEFH